MLFAGASCFQGGQQVVLMFGPSANLHLGAKMGRRDLAVLPDHRVATSESVQFQLELHRNQRKTLYLGVNADCYDGCYVKDNGTSLGWDSNHLPVYLQFPMGPRHRKKEVGGFRSVLEGILGINPIQIENRSEGGDVSAITLPTEDRHLFMGVRDDARRRTSKRAVSEIRGLVGSRWHVHHVPFNTLEDRYLHLDSGANFVGQFDGKPTWLIDPEAYPERPFRDAGFEVIHVVRGERGVSAYLGNYGVLFIPKTKRRTIKKLRRLGFKVVPVAFDHHERADAGVPCITNTITLPPNWKMRIEDASS